jgi:two-component system LytT family response regulator
MDVLIINCDALTVAAITRFSSELKQLSFVAKVAANGTEAMEMMPTTSASVLFVDVDVFLTYSAEILHLAGKKAMAIVYIASDNSFALPSLREDKCFYLLKPLRREDFLTTMRAIRKKSNPPPFTCEGSKVCLRVSREPYSFHINDIVCVKGSANYSYFFLAVPPGKLLVCASIGAVHRQLPSIFCRPHNSFLVNLCHVKQVVAGDPAYIILSNGNRAQVSRRNKASLERKMAEREHELGHILAGGN